GRTNILERNDRPHMFVKELQLYIDYIKEQINATLTPDNKFIKYCTTYCKNLIEGISYYQGLVVKNAVSTSWKSLLEQPLADLRIELEALLSQNQLESSAYQNA